MTSSASPGQPGDKPTASAPRQPPWWRPWLIPLGLLLSAWLLLPSIFRDAPQLSYTEFLQRVDRGDVDSVTIEANGDARGRLDDGSSFTTAVPVDLAGDGLLERLEEAGVTIEAVPDRTTLWDVLLSLAPFLLLVGLWVYLGRRAGAQFGGFLGIGRSRAKIFDTERPRTTFADIAGYEGVKQEIAEVVEFLRNPERYRRAGARAPRGVLMVGPPGTGKTLFARAVAGEADVPFITVTGSSFVEMFVGVGAARVRDLFEEARKRAPAIVFVDEIDAIGQRRGAGGGFVSNDEREQTLNQLLAEMDGFDPREGIIVLAATNRPEILDPALLRPGRFDRQVTIPLPNQRERRAILELHCRDKKLAPDVDLDKVARGTPGFDERHLYRESYLRDSLAVRLGGRAAELVVFGEGSTGAASDLASATDLATKMVREYGLSPDIGPIGYPAGGPMFLGDGALPVQHRSYSEATQHMIDREVARLLREAEERASALLDEHRAELDRLTELLLEQETVDGVAVYDLVGRPMPGGSPQVLTASPDGRETADVG